jgi:hypothetical protein
MFLKIEVSPVAEYDARARSAKNSWRRRFIPHPRKEICAQATRRYHLAADHFEGRFQKPGIAADIITTPENLVENIQTFKNASS